MAMSDMSMSSTMPMSTASMTAMPSATSTMDMSSSSMSMPMQNGMMPMSAMSMTFFTAHTTPLYSMSWMPATTGQYAGTCIFLIVLSLLLRAMYGVKCRMEAAWTAKDLKRRYIVAQPAGKVADSDSDVEVMGAKGSEAVLTANGVTERVKVVQGSHVSGAMPFRLSVDLTRACMVTLMVGVGYLLMLAVMTMNVGYFLSVLAGAFLGELCFGRFSTHHVEEHH